MEKDFGKWLVKKQLVNARADIPFFREGEIWRCYLGLNIGSEQDGRGEDFLRPVIILKKFNKQVFWAIPLTTAKKDKFSSFYYLISFISGQQSTAILSQLRLLDARRLIQRMGIATSKQQREIKERLKELIH